MESCRIIEELKIKRKIEREIEKEREGGRRLREEREGSSLENFNC